MNSIQKENIVQKKSFDFAIRVVNSVKYLQTHHKEFVMTKQLLKSGTSIGANIEEALGGQSRKDFIAKLSISYKEARETRYWIKLLFATDYLTEEMNQSLMVDINELTKLLVSIIKTTKNNS
jgi:four helix bundle protein